MAMNIIESIGYLASLLVLATFCMRDMVTLRVFAIASNLAFIAYGGLAGVGPVLLLHLALLPVNVLRLVESIRSVSVTSQPARRLRPAPVDAARDQ